MDFILSPVEVRVLGALIEKEFTTPENCPLTLNSLVLACNQKSNRDPVTAYADDEVQDALETLRTKQLAWQRSIPGSRTLKYEQNLKAKFGFEQRELAVACVLMLRGPSTVGEIRGYTGRMYQFRELPEVEESLNLLINWESGPIVTRLPRLPGTKEPRFAHLFSGEVAIALSNEVPGEIVETLGGASLSLTERVARLEEELAATKKAFEEFRKSFE
jgi:uncharacterized protein YceH (UPF0502 family)